ncbi:hypothetical protein [Parvibacter caecicola]|uniref:Zinc-ribbon domain-containing protein n=1 Tax=Parvibacter caecicola TaxID=747645 RepID=A0A4T9TKK5_9ACTN|nr:hypothetical protein [Parvibacter caecicola]TJW12493.1 hypothetical protein E5982_02590 [Parvibacter caecicola]
MILGGFACFFVRIGIGEKAMFCKKCGTKVEEGAWLCCGCGAQVGEKPVNTQAREDGNPSKKVVLIVGAVVIAVLLALLQLHICDLCGKLFFGEPSSLFGQGTLCSDCGSGKTLMQGLSSMFA